MGSYGYCVVPQDNPPAAGLTGIDGSAVLGRVVEDLLVWFSEIERPEPDVKHVQAHNSVVEAAITGTVTPVPLRFGQWSGDGGEFDRLIAEKAEWYRERLALFAGALEFGIRVVRPDKQAAARVVRLPPAESGTAYMEALRRSAAAVQVDREEADRVLQGITETMNDLVREERSEQGSTPHGIVTVSHLVERAQFEPYRERVNGVRGRFPELRFMLSGPWAPYSFSA